MPRSRTHGKKQPRKVGATHADRNNISSAFQKKMVEFSEKPLEDLEAIAADQISKKVKPFGGSYQQAFEFALLMKRKEKEQPQPIGEEEAIELDGLSATITPVEDLKEEYSPSQD